VIAINRLRPYEKSIAHRTKRDQAFHDTLGWIHFKYARMCKARSLRKRPADRYVIAIAKRCGFDLVCEETLEMKPSTKIPYACLALGVRCLTIDELLAQEKTLF
jgi:hypothetical protein